MTQTELEAKVQQNANDIAAIKTELTRLSASIASVSNSLANYVLNTQLASTNSTVSSNTKDISSLTTMVNNLSSSIGLVNKISKLLDVNIVDLEQGDVLQYDGDRWTNQSASAIIPEQSITLEGLVDVQINSDKTSNHALLWDNTLNKWTNKKVVTSDSSGAIQIDMSEVWDALSSSDSSKQIDISHCNWAINKNGGTGYNLKVEQGLTVTGGADITNGGIKLNVGSSNVAITGDAVSTGEITAYK